MSLADQLGFRFQPPERRAWTVRGFGGGGAGACGAAEYSDAWVEGEISNFRARLQTVVGHLRLPN